MNCLEFRRILLTDPGTRDPAFVEHKRSCADCADAVGRSAQFEQRLREAVRIEAPENLASRILLKHSFASPVSKPWWRNTAAVALAASLLLVVGLVVSTVIGTHARHQRLSEEFVALVNGAPIAL